MIYGPKSHMGLEPLPYTITSAILELDIISHSIQIHERLLWDNDVYIFNNDNHGNIELVRNIIVIPPNMIYTSPMWDPYGSHMGLGQNWYGW